MGKINKSYFKKILIAMSALFLTLVGNHCGKFSPTDLRLSADGSRGFVTARFFQDDQIYEKDLAFRNLSGYALFEDDIVLGKIDELNSKPLNFVLPSAKTGVLDFEEFNGVQSFAFAIQGGRLWTKGIVPYVITSAVSGATGSVESAMRAITDNTGIKFVKRTNGIPQKNWIVSQAAFSVDSYSKGL
ncbi:MAG: hypothetical protein IPL83_01950 [Bdellovibrionales bacterium]|nr:hypothetical protein [Bdellovibrionales bacterium]